MRAVTANCFMELVAGDAKRFGPVGNIGGHLRIDLLRIVWTFCMFLVNRMRLVRLWCIVMLGHHTPLCLT